MSVLHRFQVRIAKFGYDPRRVYMSDQAGDHSTFDFSFHCTAQLPIRKVHFFFDMNKGKVLVMYRDMELSQFDCACINFFVHDDKPVLTVQWLTMQSELENLIADSFKEQHATWLFDKMINQQ